MNATSDSRGTLCSANGLCRQHMPGSRCGCAGAHGNSLGGQACGMSMRLPLAIWGWALSSLARTQGRSLWAASATASLKPISEGHLVGSAGQVGSARWDLPGRVGGLSFPGPGEGSASFFCRFNELDSKFAHGQFCRLGGGFSLWPHPHQG